MNETWTKREQGIRTWFAQRSLPLLVMAGIVVIALLAPVVHTYASTIADTISEAVHLMTNDKVREFSRQLVKQTCQSRHSTCTDVEIEKIANAAIFTGHIIFGMLRIIVGAMVFPFIVAPFVWIGTVWYHKLNYASAVMSYARFCILISLEPMSMCTGAMGAVILYIVSAVPNGLIFVIFAVHFACTSRVGVDILLYITMCIVEYIRAVIHKAKTPKAIAEFEREYNAYIADKLELRIAAVSEPSEPSGPSKPLQSTNTSRAVTPVAVRTVLSIDGNIADGKSTLVGEFGKIGYTVFKERVHGNFLTEVTKDPSLVFGLQTMIMANEITFQTTAEMHSRDGKNVITDRSPMGVLAFSLVTWFIKSMTDKQLEIILDIWHERWIENRNLPLTQVFLNVDPIRSKGSIKTRGNEYELGLSIEYLTGVHRAHLAVLVWNAFSSQGRNATWCVVPYTDFGVNEMNRTCTKTRTDMILHNAQQMVDNRNHFTVKGEPFSIKDLYRLFVYLMSLDSTRVAELYSRFETATMETNQYVLDLSDIPRSVLPETPKPMLHTLSGDKTLLAVTDRPLSTSTTESEYETVG